MIGARPQRSEVHPIRLSESLRVIAFLVLVWVLMGSGILPAQESLPDSLDLQDAVPTRSPQDSTTEITVGAEKVEDRFIEQRLADVYRQIPTLTKVQIAVNAGVVRLTGYTPTKEAHKQALELAKRVEGVVSVTDDITEKREVHERLLMVQEKVINQINAFIAYLPLLFIGVAVFLGFWVLASFLTRWDRLYRTVTPHTFLQSLLKQIVRGGALFIGFIVMLEILDATALLGTIVGIAGVMGLAIGFALRDTVENYIASILLSIRQPFRPLDQIVIENYEGLVMKLTSRETILMTLDGNHVRIPNATVYKGNILNYSRNPKRRFTFEVGIDTAVNIEDARQLAIKTLQHICGVIPDPPVLCAIEKLGDSNVILKMFAWTSQDQYDYLKVRSESIRAVKEAFDRAQYDMPEPIYRLKVQGYSLQTEHTDPVGPDQHIPQSPRTPSAPARRSEADVSRDHHIVEQISNDRENGEEINLLRSDK